MTQLLDLTDIQGNIVKPYGRYRFPAARFLLLQIKQADQGREFVCAVTEKVTTAVRWDDGSPAAVPKPKAPPISPSLSMDYGNWNCPRHR